MAAGFQFSSTLRLGVPIVLQTLIQMAWPASLHLTLSSSFMLWAELPGPGEETYSSESVDYNESSSAPLKYDWNVLEHSFEFNERRFECLCAAIFNTQHTGSCSCFSGVKWSEAGGGVGGGEFFSKYI